ncbi:MAG: membrane protein [Leptospiraceae bacterium]|nr:MAG: membrane protein [Leptospiraceae bacterium]
MDAFYIVALSSGFLGGLSHCSFMCGPIISSLVIENKQTHFNLFWAQFLYHSGRIFTYSSIGFLIGYTGSFLNTITIFSGIKNIVMILVGLYLIIKGMEMLGFIKHLSFLFNKIERSFRFFSNLIIIIRDVNSIWKYFLYGLFLGFLPCGLSYTAFIASAAMNDPFKGFLFMFLFGLANIPALFIVVSFSYKILSKSRNILYYITGITFLFFGSYLLYKEFIKFIKI